MNTVLAVSDKELIGQTLTQGEIEIQIKEKFYKDKEITEKELAKLIKEHDNINLIGKKAVGVAIKEKIITEEGTIKINKVPHAQIYQI